MLNLVKDQALNRLHVQKCLWLSMPRFVQEIVHLLRIHIALYQEDSLTRLRFARNI